MKCSQWLNRLSIQLYQSPVQGTEFQMFTQRKPCAMKNASTVWGGIFYPISTRKFSTPSDQFRVRVPGNPFSDEKYIKEKYIIIYFILKKIRITKFLFQFCNSLYSCKNYYDRVSHMDLYLLMLLLVDTGISVMLYC